MISSRVWETLGGTKHTPEVRLPCFGSQINEVHGYKLPRDAGDLFSGKSKYTFMVFSCLFRLNWTSHCFPPLVWFFCTGVQTKTTVAVQTNCRAVHWWECDLTSMQPSYQVYSKQQSATEVDWTVLSESIINRKTWMFGLKSPCYHSSRIHSYLPVFAPAAPTADVWQVIKMKLWDCSAFFLCVKWNYAMRKS